MQFEHMGSIGPHSYIYKYNHNKYILKIFIIIKFYVYVEKKN